MGAEGFHQLRMEAGQGKIYSEEPEPRLVALGQGTIAKV